MTKTKKCSWLLLLCLCVSVCAYGQGLTQKQEDRFRAAATMTLKNFYSFFKMAAKEPEDGNLLDETKELFTMGETSIFKPDFVASVHDDGLVSFDAYLSKFRAAYGAYLEDAEIEFKQSDFHFEPLVADGRQLFVNCRYRNQILVDDKQVFSGESQAILYFPDVLNTDGCKIRLLSPYEEGENASASSGEWVKLFDGVISQSAVQSSISSGRTLQAKSGSNFGRSLIPGWAQFHKGQKAKGAVIIAAEALSVGGIIYTESQRSAYQSKMNSQPSYAAEYKKKRDNFATARNCCIGAAAAVYLYNLIDGWTSKPSGKRRVAIQPYTSDAELMSGLTCSISF